MTEVFRVAIVGAGRVGTALALQLQECSEFSFRLADFLEEAQIVAGEQGLACELIDATRTPDISRFLTDADAVVAAMPAAACVTVARVAAEMGIAYLDLSDESVSLDEIRRLAATAPAPFLPQCGLSPGIVSTLVLEMLAGFGAATEVVIRTGTLPRNATNRLGYGLTWNVRATVDEYFSPAVAVIEGALTRLQPLTEPESLWLDGRPYEAFVAGNVPVGLQGKAPRIVAKSLRYPGHLDLIQFLISDFKLAKRPDILERLMLNGLPNTDDDEFVIAITARGIDGYRHREVTRVWRALPARIGNVELGAMRFAAASHVAAVLDLLRLRQISATGLVTQEELPSPQLLASPFLRWLRAAPNLEQRS
jgi:saccharopine dehydrogenase-like NADP-dependent oxidoreductase